MQDISQLKQAKEQCLADITNKELAKKVHDVGSISSPAEIKAILEVLATVIQTEAAENNRIQLESGDGDGKLLLHFAYPHWSGNHDFRSPNQVELNPLLFPEVKPGSWVTYIAGEVFATIR